MRNCEIDLDRNLTPCERPRLPAIRGTVLDFNLDILLNPTIMWIMRNATNNGSVFW
jgi:hypothetical protein